MSRHADLIVASLLILLMCKACIVTVVSIQQHAVNEAALEVLKKDTCRTQWGHRCGCQLVYNGYDYEWRGKTCPKE